jgi:hypothetical protein
LLEADERGARESALISAASPATPITDVVSPLPGLKPPTRVDAAPVANTAPEANVSQRSSALVACSADLLNDNWGAQWFIDNFYNNAPFGCSNGFTASNDQTNVASTWQKRGAGQNWE